MADDVSKAIYLAGSRVLLLAHWIDDLPEAPLVPRRTYPHARSSHWTMNLELAIRVVSGYTFACI